MLNPSYAELMDILNKESEGDVTSRYTVVIAAAKRARQLIDGDEPMVDVTGIEGKPVSIAVEEIRQGKIKIVPEGEGTVIMPKKSVEARIRAELEAQSQGPDEDIEDNDESDEDIVAEAADEFESDEE